jgi:adenine phosphoribosyltransferase
MPHDLDRLIREIPDFPEPGILFRDITPLLADADGLSQTLDWLEALYRGSGIDAVVGIESRGFLFGTPLADRLGLGFVPVRKPGKLPAVTHQEEYVLEYGTNIVEIHQDALQPGQRVAVIDDLLATGGTALATGKLVEMCGATVHSFAFVIELPALGGRSRLADYEIETLLQY